MNSIPSQKRGLSALAVLTIILSATRIFAAVPTLIWGDEFNQADNSAPDAGKWNYDLGGGGWGNNELETYTNSRANSYVTSDPGASDGKALVITAVKDANGAYTSARLLTLGKFSTTYGRIEARLKTSSGKGLWPAFWMLGSSIGSGLAWPNCGEIDIMEAIGDSPKTAYGTLHGPGYSGANGIQGASTLPGGASFNTAYHVFSVQWSPDRIAWSMDGAVYKVVTPAQAPGSWVFNNSPFFIIMNLAVGGNWPGNPDGTTAFPAEYRIDYVRVYGLPAAPPVAGTASAASATQVNLTWTAPADLQGFTLTGYRVERATDSAFTQNLVARDSGLATAFTDGEVAGGINYYYRVAAVSTGGVSDPSSVLSVVTPVAAVAPVFTVQPAGQIAPAGNPVAFTAAASGSPAPAYQWRRNGQDITGAIESSYTISRVSAADAGTYTVVASNSAGSTVSSGAVLTVTSPGAADFNGDGKPDLLWLNSVTGERAVWLMNGTNFLAASTLGDFPLEWTIAATGDFNADGQTDIVWSNSLTGERALWMMNGTNLLAVSTLGIFPLEWTVAATGDFNGDGKPDLVWSNSLTGERALWLMNGTQFLAASTLGVFPLEWTVAATGDFNGDGKPDLVWSNSLTGERALWLMDGTTRIGVSTLGLFPLEWTVAGTADFNGDGKPDIIWSNSVTGERALWLMDGTNFIAASTLGVFPLEWAVKN